jgi:hypothetical protein
MNINVHKIKRNTFLLSTTTLNEQHRLLNTCIGSGYFGSISPGAAASIIILQMNIASLL